jgi:hypothetical protein
LLRRTMVYGWRLLGGYWYMVMNMGGDESLCMMVNGDFC